MVEYCAARGGTEEDAVRYGLAAHGVIDKVLVGVGFAGVKTLTKRGKRVRLTKVDAINLSQKTYRDKVSAERINQTPKDFLEKIIQKRNVGVSGEYKKLTTVGAPFKDGLEAHHIVSDKWLQMNEMNPKKGFAVVMTEEQHKLTRTWGRKGANIDPTVPYRSEFGRNMRECIDILKADGSWNPDVRKSIMGGLNQFKKDYPDLFKKVMK